MKLHLDRHGVLAAFDPGVQAVTGRRFEELWAFRRPHDPTILTGLPLGHWAPERKRRFTGQRRGAATTREWNLHRKSDTMTA